MKDVPLQLKKEANTKQTPFRLGDDSRKHLAAIITHRSRVEFGHPYEPQGAVNRVPSGARIVQELLEEEYNRITNN